MESHPLFVCLGPGFDDFTFDFYSPELVESTGAKNWVTIGSVTLFQPSEFMKVSYILMLARASIWFRHKVPEDNLKTIGSFLESLL